jgi:hypothetical protein
VNTNIGSTYDLTVGAVVIAYLAMILYLWGYTRRSHARIWTEMGKPTFVPTMDSVRQSLLTTKFLCSRTADRSGDAKLIAIVWIIRALFIVAIGLIVWLPRSN